MERFYYTNQEVAHSLLLFLFSGQKTDFTEAFKSSPFGANYFWDKLQRKINIGTNRTEAIVDVFLSIDCEHQNMMISYILDKKYRESILTKRRCIKNAALL
jgi:hypothetical protein